MRVVSDKFKVSLLKWESSCSVVLRILTKNLYDKKLLLFKLPIRKDGIGMPFSTTWKSFPRFDLGLSISTGGILKIKYLKEVVLDDEEIIFSHNIFALL